MTRTPRGNREAVIVVVEPNVFMRFVIVESLQRKGRTLLHATCLEEALMIVRSSHVSVDLAILAVDFVDPHELEVCREIAQYSPKTRILVVSDSLPARRLAKAEQWNAVQRPFHPHPLLQKVRAALSR